MIKPSLHHLDWSKATAADVKETIAKGADPNERDPYGRTPLFDAVLFNNIEGVKALIEGGADVNATAPSGEATKH